MTVITSNNIPKISLKIRKLLVMKTLSCSMDLLTICNYMTNRQLYGVIVYNYLTAFFNEFTWCNSGKAGFVEKTVKKKMIYSLKEQSIFLYSH